MAGVAGLQYLAKIDLEVTGGPRTGAVIVETPHAAVGQDPPPDPALRLNLGRRQIPDYLIVGRRGLAPAVAAASVQEQAEPLALFHHDGVMVALSRAGSGNGLFLGVSVGKQQEIRNVFVPGGALLWQVIGPSQQFQNRADQFLLRDRLVRVLRMGQGVVSLTDTVPECVELRRSRDGGAPFRRGLDPVSEEVVGE